MIARRLVAIGVAVVFVGAVQVLDAAGVEGALDECLAAAIVATFVTWVTAP